ncbi:hypothetical protein ACU686_23400 [Yinghuangia aomiensis]
MTQAADDPREVSPAPSPASTAPWTLPPSPTGAGTPTPADAPHPRPRHPRRPLRKRLPSLPRPRRRLRRGRRPGHAGPSRGHSCGLQSRRRAQGARPRPADEPTRPRDGLRLLRPRSSDDLRLSHLSDRGLGTSAAIVGIAHPRDETPDPTRPRPLPILPPGCVIAATVPTGHLVTCADDS